MVDVEFDITGKNDKEARENAAKIRHHLEQLYVNEFKRNDLNFLDYLEKCHQEIIQALALPPDCIKRLRAANKKLTNGGR